MQGPLAHRQRRALGLQTDPAPLSIQGSAAPWTAAWAARGAGLWVGTMGEEAMCMGIRQSPPSPLRDRAGKGVL